MEKDHMPSTGLYCASPGGPVRHTTGCVTSVSQPPLCHPDPSQPRAPPRQQQQTGVYQCWAMYGT